MRREIINRFSLCEQFPIETWQKIAEATSLLKLQDANNEKEFKENLRILKQNLMKTEVSLKEGSRYTKNFMEVGTSTLLQAIYDIKVSDKKKHLIEEINILKELGIKHIRWEGSSNHIGSLHRITSMSYKGTFVLNKTFTDGTFYINQNEKHGRDFFTIKKSENSTYFLDINLVIRPNDKIISENSKAILLNFDGIFPSPEEIIAPYQPFLEQESIIIGWQETTSPVKEVFTPYVKQKK